MWDLIVSVPDHCLSFYFAHASYLKWRYFFDIWSSLVEEKQLNFIRVEK